MGMGVVRQEKPEVRNVQEALNRGDRNDWRLLSAAAGSSPTIKGSTIVGLMNEAAGVPIVLIWDTEPRSDQSGVAY
jgi:hypothetical protein